MVAMLGLLALASLVPELDAGEGGPAAALAGRRPAMAWIARHLNPQRVTANPFFLLLPAYLFAGISWSLVQRTRQFLRAAARGGEPAGARFLVRREWMAEGAPEATVDKALGEIRRLGYEERERTGGSWAGSRGRLGFAGSLAFHVGLLLVLVGVATSARTRLTGEVVLTEGFDVPLEPAAMLWLSGAGRFPELPGCTLALRDLRAEYSAQGTPVDYAGLLSVRRGGEPLVERLVRVNDAFDWEGFQLTLHRFGYAPGVTARDAAGRKRLDGIAVLQLLPPGRVDALPLESGGELRLALYPDFATAGGQATSRTPRPVNPVLAFSWRAPDGRELAAGRVGLGEEAAVGGYRVAFDSLQTWGAFVLARDFGLWFFVAGSLCGALGMLVRLAFPDQTLRLSWATEPEGMRLRLLAGTRFLPALHEEQIDRLVDRIRSPKR